MPVEHGSRGTGQEFRSALRFRTVLTTSAAARIGCRLRQTCVTAFFPLRKDLRPEWAQIVPNR